MPRSPFLVNVGSILKSVGETLHEHRVGEIPNIVVSETSVPNGSEIEVDVDIQSAIGGMDVKGTVSSPWVSQCRRCLAEINGGLQAQVSEMFTAEGDEDSYHLDQDEIDLEPLARDAVVLSLPIAPLCKEDCAGLCPNCGVNHNETTCDCEVDLRDPRWSVLDELKTDE